MKNKIMSHQVGFIIFFISISTLAFENSNIMLYTAKQDIWISTLIGGVLGFIPLLIYLYIINYKEDFNIIMTTRDLFGKKIGTLLNIIIIIAIFSFALITLNALSNLSVNKFLYLTPEFLIRIIFLLLALYTVIKGLDVIMRASVIVGVITLILLLLNFLPLLLSFEFNNLMPILEYGINPIIKSSLLHPLIMVIPLSIILIIPKKRIINKEKYNKTIIYSYLFSYIIIFLYKFLLIANLGIELSNVYKNPAIMLVRKLDLFQAFDKFQNIFSLIWVIFFFFTLTYSLYFISKSIHQEFKINNKKYFFIATLLITFILLIISLIIYNNNALPTNKIYNIFLSFQTIVLLIIPIIISIKILINKKHQPPI